MHKTSQATLITIALFESKEYLAVSKIKNSACQRKAEFQMLKKSEVI